mmetsp:Transcript_34529/g.75587  ORF Transcript_34529/g.75587 Transcript_34529/m.75587 type:complete len:379 (+) Transcript_34529:48-1184(+)
MEAELNWIEEAEQSVIDTIREAVKSDVADFGELPDDMTHDLTIARFLRGNASDAKVAEDLFRRSLEHRRELNKRPEIAAARKAIEKHVIVDISHLPFFDELSEKKLLPLRGMDGMNVNDLPTLLVAPGLLDCEALGIFLNDEKEVDKFRTFMLAHLEQRAIVLHNLSMEQKRMVKFVDVRDLFGVSAGALLGPIRSFMGFLSALFKEVQDFYPEIIHQARVLNAPAAFSTVFAIISLVLNARMKSKIQIFSSNQPFSVYAELLKPRAVYSWISQAHPHKGEDDIHIAKGVQEEFVVWVQKGESVKWSVSVTASDLAVPWVFYSEGVECAVQQESVASEAPIEKELTAGGDGVLWIGLNNVSSWFTSKQAQVTVQKVKQ